MFSETSMQTYDSRRYSNQGECRLKFFFFKSEEISHEITEAKTFLHKVLN